MNLTDFNFNNYLNGIDLLRSTPCMAAASVQGDKRRNEAL